MKRTRAKRPITIKRHKLGAALMNNPNDENVKTQLINAWNNKFVKWGKKYADNNNDAEDIYMISVEKLLNIYMNASKQPNELYVSQEIITSINSFQSGKQYQFNNSMDSISRPKIKQWLDQQIDENAINSDYRLDMLILHTYINRLVETLTDREGSIIELRYGYFDNIYYQKALTNEFEQYPRTLSECAWLYNVSTDRVRQILNKALRKLGHKSRLNLLNGFIK